MALMLLPTFDILQDLYRTFHSHSTLLRCEHGRSLGSRLERSPRQADDEHNSQQEGTNTRKGEDQCHSLNSFALFRPIG